MKRSLTIIIGTLLLVNCQLIAQQKSVLFIGNSYTGYNNLPQMVANVALSTGDTLNVDSNTPGGARLLNHAVNPQTLSKIASQNWDYVAIQAQSQEPSWPIGQVQTDVFPYATILCDSIRSGSSCSMPVFYMTWGRKNGDANNCPNWPPVCTYQGMDSLLSERYQTMANDNNALVSPVGAVWKYIRANHPGIELYTADESHPSLAGSYAAACAFYVTILRKDPTAITENAGLSATEAQQIRAAAKIVVYDDLLQWNIGEYDPVADFSFSSTGNTVNFTNQSAGAASYLWFFGDGDSSSLEHPAHVYANPGNYAVTLDAMKCGQFSAHSDTVSIVMSVDEVNQNLVIKVYPNPASEIIQIDVTELQNEDLRQVKVIDLQGKCVRTIPIGGRTNILTVSVLDIPAGLYLIQISSTEKIVATQTIEVVH